MCFDRLATDIEFLCNSTDAVACANEDEHLQFAIAQQAHVSRAFHRPIDQFVNSEQCDTRTDIQFSAKNRVDRCQQLIAGTDLHPIT